MPHRQSAPDGAPWEFDYEPIRDAVFASETGREVVLAFRSAVDVDVVAASLRGLAKHVEAVVARAPLFWIVVRLATAVGAGDIERQLRAAGLPVRYAALVTEESMRVPEPLVFTNDQTIEPEAAWMARPTSRELMATAEGHWFIGPEGISARGDRCGMGLGGRLAVIDDDAGGSEELDLDAEIAVRVDTIPKIMRHGAQMVAWAVGTREGERSFAGVAPGASVRLYCIPKPGIDAFALPLAIVRAVEQGADVIVAATYLEGSTTPMLDDALEFATRMGRRGRGTAVVIPTGRQPSSPRASVHGSFALGLGDPASDPRVFCVAPSGREGGWFWWQDRKGIRRPFANRGPSVRFMAPGDDIGSPFDRSRKLCHAESSGASAIAAGALLLVLEANPDLELAELGEIVALTAKPIDPTSTPPNETLGDWADTFPHAIDRDGHNAKHGYGIIDVEQACLVASDPVTACLVEIGELDAARMFAERMAKEPMMRTGYSNGLARWGARAVRADAATREAVKVLLRHLRLLPGHEHRGEAHAPGAELRCLASLLRGALASRRAPSPSDAVRAELERLVGRVAFWGSSVLRARQSEQWLAALAAKMWASAPANAHPAPVQPRYETREPTATPG